MEVKVLEGQSLLDLAIQTAGSVEAAYALAMANELSVTDNLLPGQQLQSVSVTNRDIAAYYDSKQLKPATSADVDITNISRVFFREAPLEFS